ncbi:MAG: hypothetical protein R2911_46470 [Caldilineaceae bacterium]
MQQSSTLHIVGRNGVSWDHDVNSATGADPLLILSEESNQLFVINGFDLSALSTKSGQIQWSIEFDEPVWAGQLLYDERLLIHLELSIVCLKLTGEECWRYHHNDIITEVLIKDEALHMHDFEEQPFTLDLHTGN